MKTLLYCLGILLLGAVHSYAQNKFSTYNNERFVYSIEYPSDLLKMQPPPENGDGRLFESEDGAVRMLVWGQYNALVRTWNEEYEFDLKGFGSKPTYTIIKPDWFVISGIKDGKISYQKTLRRTMHQKLGRLDVFYKFTIEYPSSSAAKLGPVVKRISASFRFDPTADV
jgi:hypothetical protein